MTMTATPEPAGLARRLKRFMGDYPLVPLLILLILLIAVLQILRPGIVNERWIANTVKFAIPLALLAGSQTLTMLTGGIDLSVATVATMAAFIVSTQDPALALPLAFAPALLIGLANGIGVGVFRVHPLIMTLGTSLIGTGCLQVYQRTVIATGTKVPETLAWLGTGLSWGIPNALLVFLPAAALIMFTLRRRAASSVTWNAMSAIGCSNGPNVPLALTIAPSAASSARSSVTSSRPRSSTAAMRSRFTVRCCRRAVPPVASIVTSCRSTSARPCIVNDTFGSTMSTSRWRFS